MEQWQGAISYKLHGKRELQNQNQKRLPGEGNCLDHF
jgi:hypothetical protein